MPETQDEAGVELTCSAEECRHNASTMCLAWLIDKPIRIGAGGLCEGFETKDGRKVFKPIINLEER